ncbi:hypothetical protein RB213_000271, partial [Colletotrichum asianum]
MSLPPPGKAAVTWPLSVTLPHERVSLAHECRPRPRIHIPQQASCPGAPTGLLRLARAERRLNLFTRAAPSHPANPA